MEFRVVHRNAEIAPRKTRYVIDLIRGEDVNRALEILDFTSKRGAVFVKKLLRSAVANASQQGGVNVNRLYVREARVDGGPAIRSNFMPGPMGRALPVRRRLSHIHLSLAERAEERGIAGAAAAAAPEKGQPEKAKKQGKASKAAQAKPRGKKK